MENGLNKRYGLLTAIAMVVGIVIGSGVFFKAELVLNSTGGNIPLGIAAWLIVGGIMIVCSYSFAIMAGRYNKVNGVVDYAEMMVGKKYGYYVGWFLAIIYFPTIASVLAWVSARYTCVIFGWDITGGSCMVIACLYLCAVFAMNALSPILAGKFQVSTTVIKLIPLIIMAVVGSIKGASTGMLANNFNTVVNPGISTGSGLAAAVVSVSFAYEGWIIATSINSELKDAKKNLPIALVLGAIIVVVVYIVYYIGLAGTVTTATLMESGEAAAKIAFQNILGKSGGTIAFVLIVVSCLGTLNGLMVGCTRGLYSLAARKTGPNPKLFGVVDPVSNMPVNSCVVGVLLCAVWLFYFYGANLTGPCWFGPFQFDSSEITVVTLYALYVPIFIMLMRKAKDLNVFKRVLAPIIASCGCAFMVIAAIIAHGKACIFYLIIFAAIMILGAKYAPKTNEIEEE